MSFGRNKAWEVRDRVAIDEIPIINVVENPNPVRNSDGQDITLSNCNVGRVENRKLLPSSLHLDKGANLNSAFWLDEVTLADDARAGTLKRCKKVDLKGDAAVKSIARSSFIRAGDEARIMSVADTKVRVQMENGAFAGSVVGAPLLILKNRAAVDLASNVDAVKISNNSVIGEIRSSGRVTLEDFAIVSNIKRAKELYLSDNSYARKARTDRAYIYGGRVGKLTTGLLHCTPPKGKKVNLQNVVITDNREDAVFLSGDVTLVGNIKFIKGKGTVLVSLDNKSGKNPKIKKSQVINGNIACLHEGNFIYL